MCNFPSIWTEKKALCHNVTLRNPADTIGWLRWGTTSVAWPHRWSNRYSQSCSALGCTHRKQKQVYCLSLATLLKERVGLLFGFLLFGFVPFGRVQKFPSVPKHISIITQSVWFQVEGTKASTWWWSHCTLSGRVKKSARLLSLPGANLFFMSSTHSHFIFFYYYYY